MRVEGKRGGGGGETRGERGGEGSRMVTPSLYLDVLKIK
jgi:hypothetical protein